MNDFLNGYFIGRIGAETGRRYRSASKAARKRFWIILGVTAAIVAVMIVLGILLDI